MLLDLIRGLVRGGLPSSQSSDAGFALTRPRRRRGSKLARMARRFSRRFRRGRARARWLGSALSLKESESDTDMPWGRFRRLRLRRTLGGAGGASLIIHVPRSPGPFTCNRITRAIARGFKWGLKRSRQTKGKAGLNVIFADTLKLPPRQ